MSQSQFGRFLSPAARLLPAVVTLAVLSLAGGAQADEIKINGFWINDVAITAIGGGNVTYITGRGSEVSKPISDVEGMRLTNYADLEPADAALAEGKGDEAAKLYRKVRSDAREKWLKHYTSWRLVQALQLAEKNTSAISEYLKLVGADADAMFLADPPLKAAASLKDSERGSVVKDIDGRLKGARGTLKESLAALRDAAQGDVSVAEVAAAEGQEPAAIAPEDSAVVLPQRVGESAAVPLLRAGKFEEALATVNEELRVPRGSMMKLYLKGVAQLALAERSNDEKLYKDAGLSFMRVVIYTMPRTNQYLGPSLLEAAYVHEKVGRSEKAAELYAQAESLIDEEDDPYYYKRMLELTAGDDAGGNASTE